MQNGHGRESGGCVELGLETKENGSVPVSYTHLTLPTILRV